MGGYPSSPPPLPPVLPPPSGGRRNFLGLPLWSWLCLALVVIVGVGVVIVAGGSDDEKRTSTTIDTTTPTRETSPATDDTTAPTLTEPEVTEPDITEPEITAPEITEPTAPISADEVSGSPAGRRGTRDAPVAAGQIADIGGGWRLQVLGVTPDATAQVQAASEFNDPPPAGSTFTLVNVAMGYFGIEDPKFGFEPTVSALGSANVELTAGCGTIPDELTTFHDVFAGGVLVGNLCFVTTPAESGTLQLYAMGGFFDEVEVFLEVTSPTAAPPMAGLKGPQPGATATPARLAPTPLGTSANVGEGWSVTVTTPAHDITDAVLAENSFNEPPPAGFRYIGFDVTYAFNGTGGDTAFAVTSSAVDDSNVSLSSECGAIPTPIDGFVDVFAGGSVSGSLCFVLPADSAGFAMYGSVGFDTSPAWFSTT